MGAKNRLPAPGAEGGLIHHQSVSYSAPIPPASEFAKYEAACPGAADRILAMAEREAIHRHMNDDKLVDASIRLAGNGQKSALTIAIGSLAAIVISLFVNQPFAAIVPGIVALTSLAATFLGRRGKDSHE